MEYQAGDVIAVMINNAIVHMYVVNIVDNIAIVYGQNKLCYIKYQYQEYKYYEDDGTCRRTDQEWVVIGFKIIANFCVIPKADDILTTIPSNSEFGLTKVNVYY